VYEFQLDIKLSFFKLVRSNIVDDSSDVCLFDFYG